MSVIAPTRPASNENDVEVFVRTPSPIAGETCEACGGGAVPARYRATSQSGAELFFCAHHIRKYVDGLKAKNFAIYPEDTSFEAGAEKK